jgi:hypothetical protein
MTPTTPPSPDPHEPLRKRLEKELVGFSPNFPKRNWDAQTTHRPDRAEFPVPDLVLFALRNVLGYRWSGPEEKVRWAVHFLFSEVPVSLEMRKFGFTICYPRDKEIDIERLCGQLRVAVKLVEQWLQPLAQAQVEAGAVTVANRQFEFDGRYRFFREHADSAYQRASSPATDGSTDGKDALGSLNRLMDSWNHEMRHRHDGFYFSTAMIDAFFSRLEHQLVLLLAFRGEPLATGALKEFLNRPWDEKIKALIDVEADKDFKKFYSRLKQMKERIRNPFAHGGVENDGGSLFIHIPTIGALPANFTQFRNSVRFNFIPVEEDDHRSASDLFDSIDLMFKSGPLAAAQSFIDAGIDPSFSAESLAIYAELSSASPEEREQYFEHWHNEQDRHDNMDY